MPTSTPIDILYEDNHLLVVVKPQGLLSQADSVGDTDLLTMLKEDVKRRYKKPGKVYLGLVHRLDRDAGGVMVFARTSKAARRLAEQLQGGGFEKTYLACVYGLPDPQQGRLEHYVRKDPRTTLMRATVRKQSHAKQAVLDYELVGSAGTLNLLRIRLQTGRQHQIRAQCAAIGHPLFGDTKYGKEFYKEGQELSLWATELSFAHPVSREKLTFRSLPPRGVPWAEFRRIWP